MKLKLLCIGLLALVTGCAKEESYILDEKTFFLVMTNVQYYPEQYVNKTLEYDCFTYEINDVNGEQYVCGVRKCSSGFGCTCGNDTIIGFLLNSDLELPKARNQSSDTNEKTWIHLKGYVESTTKTNIKVHPFKADGTIDESSTENIPFLTYKVELFKLISDYSNLNYYVTK